MTSFDNSTVPGIFFFFQIIGQLQHIEVFADGGAIQFQQY